MLQGYFYFCEGGFMAKAKAKAIVMQTPLWQELAKKRAQHAPSLERIHEISKKVKINVTQLLLEERQGE
jgi:hypothetical protein